MPTLNSEAYFSELPKLDIRRSIFQIPFDHKTSFNVGEVIPFFVMEVLPADTFKMRTSVVARLQTLLTPIMDNVNLELSWWFVPMTQVMETTPQFFGENTEGPWTMDAQPHRIPYLKYPEGGFAEGTIADYMGVPVGFDPGNAPNISDKNYPMALPFRAYAKIINEFWRDQNLQQPVVIHTDEVNRNGSNGTNWITDLELGGKPFVAARYHDYFSSALPAPQRGDAISIFGAPIGQKVFADVSTLSQPHGTFGDRESMRLAFKNSGYYSKALAQDPSSNVIWQSDFNDDRTAYPTNLYANLSIPEATITQLRLAFQLQKYFERSAVTGNRYREYIQGFFGVSNGDLRMFVPEYLGGRRVPLSIHQVANTSQSEGADLGDLGAMSNTASSEDDFFHSFSQHGYLIGLAVVRFPNSYSQGLERFWTRREALEFFNPIFAHLSAQPVYRREIYLEGSQQDAANNADSVWGYQEAWADYRYKPNRVSGQMRPEAAQSLASWHLADDYESTPFLSSDWLQISKETVDRVLAVSSSNANQVFADFYCNITATRPMPVHSVPGLADHF